MVAEALIGAYVVALTIWYCSNRKVNHHKSLTNHLTTISAILSLYWYLAATGQYLSITYHTNIGGSILFACAPFLPLRMLILCLLVV